MTEAVHVRRANESDLEAIVALLEAGSLVPGKEDLAHLAGYRAALKEIDAAPAGGVIVAERGGEVVGVCQLIVFRHLQSRGGLCAEIESVHVRADLRSRGIGSRLIAEASARAREAGCYRVQLTSNLARPDAHRFYEREGFAQSHHGFKKALDP